MSTNARRREAPARPPATVDAEEVARDLHCSLSYAREVMRSLPRLILPGSRMLRISRRVWDAYLRGEAAPHALDVPRRSGPCVYVVESGPGGPLKIGFTACLRTRLARLQTGNPAPIRLLAWRTGSPADESDLHQRFASLKIRGEWFSRDALLEELVVDMRGGP